MQHQLHPAGGTALAELDGKRIRVRRYRRVAEIGLALLVLAGCYAGYRLYWIHQVRLRLDPIREAGYPTTLEELDAWYEQPAGENAAALYVESFLSFVPLDKARREQLPITGTTRLGDLADPLPADTRKLVDEHIAANQAALGLLHKAAKVRGCRYPGVLDAYSRELVEHVSHVRDLGGLLMLDAIVHSENGRPGAAARSVCSSMALGRSLRQCPVIYALLIRIWCELLTTRCFERVLNRTHLGEKELADLAGAFDRPENDRSFFCTMVGERCKGSYAFDHPEFMWGGMRGGYEWRPSHSLYEVAGLMERDHVFFLDAASEWVDAAAAPLPRRVIAFKTLEANVKRQQPNWPNRQTRQLVGLHLATFRAVCEEDAIRVAHLRAAHIGIVVEQSRLKSGKLPAALSDLVSAFIEAVPKDPFDGKPLRYKKLEKGYVVYSVGPDGRDDGAPDETDDVAFTVKR